MIRSISRVLSLTVLMAAGVVATVQPVVGQVSKAEKVVASYIVAFGRTPSQGELNWWMSQPDNSVDGYVNRHRSYIESNPGVRQDVIQRSYRFALNRAPSSGEVDWHARNYPRSTFAEKVQGHTQWLDTYPDKRREVIRASYRSAMGREPSEGEIRHWMQFRGQNFSTLTARHHQWLRESGNPRGAQVNTRLSTTVRSEIRRVAGGSALVTNGHEVAWGGASRSSVVPSTLTWGGQIISTGGGNIISTGGGNIIATGGGNIIATGGGN